MSDQSDDVALRRPHVAQQLLAGVAPAQGAIGTGMAVQTVYPCRKLLDQGGIDALRALSGRSLLVNAADIFVASSVALFGAITRSLHRARAFATAPYPRRTVLSAIAASAAIVSATGTLNAWRNRSCFLRIVVHSFARAQGQCAAKTKLGLVGWNTLVVQTDVPTNRRTHI